MAQFITQKIKKEEPTILYRIARADKTAIQECVELYGKLIWALAKQYTGSVEEAEQIVPKIFADIWKMAADCDSQICEEAVWITMIARRRLSECFLKENLQTSFEIKETEFQPSLEIPTTILPNPFKGMPKPITLAQ